jgi:hypothetical protein
MQVRKTTSLIARRKTGDQYIYRGGSTFVVFGHNMCMWFNAITAVR